MSTQLVLWGALGLCVIRLFRFATLGRFYRNSGTVAPANFVRNVIGLAGTACVLGALLVGFARPFALAGVVVAIGLLALEIVRGLPAQPLD